MNKNLATQERQVQAAMDYAKDTWCNLGDLKHLIRRGTDRIEDMPKRACEILAAEVESLRKEIARLQSGKK
jgi:hypothetical protein